MGHGKRGSEYSMVVFADNRDEAVAVAAEGLPSGAEILEARASETADDGSWHVVLRYRGGPKKRGAEGPESS